MREFTCSAREWIDVIEDARDRWPRDAVSVLQAAVQSALISHRSHNAERYTIKRTHQVRGSPPLTVLLPDGFVEKYPIEGGVEPHTIEKKPRVHLNWYK